MKWFKHMTDMSEDVKIKRVVRKFGVEGYGLYCYILERIVKKLETESPAPDLEETAQDIANDLGMDTLRVEEIMWFCVEQGLFGQDEITGRLTAHKIYKYLQQSETRSKEIRNMITAFKGVSQTVRDKCEEQNRTEQNTIEEKRSLKPPEEKKREVKTDPLKPLSPMKDPLADLIQTAFVSRVPSCNWGNVARERKSLTTLAKKFRTAAPEGPDDAARQMLNCYWQKRERATNDFWKTSPFTPSGLLGRWDALIAEFEHTARRDESAKETMEWLG